MLQSDWTNINKNDLAESLGLPVFEKRAKYEGLHNEMFKNLNTKLFSTIDIFQEKVLLFLIL